MCDEAKKEMRNLDHEELGIFHRAVTTGDGTWLTRGFFSQNHTYTLVTIRIMRYYMLYICA